MSCDYLRSAPIRRLHHPLEENPLWNMLGSAITSLVAVAVGLPFLLAFLVVLPACLSVRWLLLFIYWNRQTSRSGRGPESVRGNDSRWLGSAWRSSVIHAVLVFDSRQGLTVEHFRHLLLTRVVPLYPRLRRRPVPLFAAIGHCWMPDPHFAIERHVFPVPTFLTGQKQLQCYVSKLLKEGLADDKPPWEFQVVQPYGENQDTVAVLRVHQSVTDGTALLRVLCHSLADSQVIEIPERPLFGTFAFCVNLLRALLIGPLTLLVWLFIAGDDCNVLTHRSAWTGSVTVTWSASITLPKVLRIKQVTRSTVNCVLLSALAGALRRLLQGCGVKQPPNVKVIVPMDVRNQTSGRLSTRLGNKSSPVLLPLPVAIEGCVPRLWATRKTLESLRNSADPVVVYMATAALMTIGPTSVARGLLDLLTNKASLQFSSLPGPTSQVLVGGESLKAVYPLLPAQAKMGISITAMTYADQVYVSVIAERGLGPAAELILEYLEDQIEVLWKLLLNRRVPGEPRTATSFSCSEVAESPVREIASRLSAVQKEVQRLTEEEGQDDKLTSLRAEFSELVGELKRRQSLNETIGALLFQRDDMDPLWRPRRRAFSCSISRIQSSMALKNILPSSRPSSHGIDTPHEEVATFSMENELEKTRTMDGDRRRWHSSEGTIKGSETDVPFRSSYDQVHKIHINKHAQRKDDNKHGLVEGDWGYHKSTRRKLRAESEEEDVSCHKSTRRKLRAESEEDDMCYIKSSQGKPRSAGDIGTTPDSESDNTLDTRSEFSDTTIKISDEEMDMDYDDLRKRTGPINKNLRDLYCSNYLEHRLGLLRVEAQHMFYRDHQFQGIDEEEVVI